MSRGPVILPGETPTEIYRTPVLRRASHVAVMLPSPASGVQGTADILGETVRSGYSAPLINLHTFMLRLELGWVVGPGLVELDFSVYSGWGPENTRFQIMTNMILAS